MTTHTLTAIGLSPSTRYLYKITSISGSNSQTTSQQRFYTLVNPPQTLKIPLLEHDKAQLTWTAPAGEDVSYKVKLNGETKTDENPFDTEIMLSGLNELTNYSVEITAIDQFGNDGGTLKGSFTTPEEPLEISFVQVQPRSTSAVLTFRTNFPSRSTIAYHPTDNEALTNTIEENQFKTEHSVNLPSLLMETNYKV